MLVTVSVPVATHAVAMHLHARLFAPARMTAVSTIRSAVCEGCASERPSCNQRGSAKDNRQAAAKTTEA